MSRRALVRAGLSLALAALATGVLGVGSAEAATKSVYAKRGTKTLGSCVYTYTVRSTTGDDIVSITKVKAVNLGAHTARVYCSLYPNDIQIDKPAPLFDKGIKLASRQSHTWTTNVTRMNARVWSETQYIYRGDPYYALGGAWIG